MILATEFDPRILCSDQPAVFSQHGLCKVVPAALVALQDLAVCVALQSLQPIVEYPTVLFFRDVLGIPERIGLGAEELVSSEEHHIPISSERAQPSFKTCRSPENQFILRDRRFSFIA